MWGSKNGNLEWLILMWFNLYFNWRSLGEGLDYTCVIRVFYFFILEGKYFINVREWFGKINLRFWINKNLKVGWFNFVWKDYNEY